MAIRSLHIFISTLLIPLLTSTSALPASAPYVILNPITGMMKTPYYDSSAISPSATDLEKRTAAPIVYLSSCRNATPPYTLLIPPAYTRSAIFSYAERAASLHGELPLRADAVNIGDGQVMQWEGVAINIAFPNGEVFSSYIDADAGDRPDFSYAGFADINGKGGSGYQYGFVAFSCFKDDSRELFRTGSNNACFSIYYCLAE